MTHSQVFFRTLCTAAVFVAASSSLPAQTVVYVNAAMPDEGNGTSWATSHKYLAAALTNAAAKADAGQTVQVWIAAGSYLPDQSVTYPDGAVDPNASFMLHNSVGIFGGFAGTETSIGQRDPAANIVLLIGFPDDANGTRNVVTASGVDSSASLDGVTLTNPRYHGGLGKAAKVEGGPLFRNCIVADNAAPGSVGAGVYCAAGSPAFEDCTFRNNVSGGLGGQGAGIWCGTGAGLVTVRNCLFENNQATGGGVCIYQLGGSLLIEDCEFTTNDASSDGSGGALTLRGAFVIRRCLFDRNTARNFGGAIVAAVPGLIEDCSFIANTARTFSGGAISGSAECVNCFFSANVSASNGGGISGGGTRTNCVFVGNRASQGGAVYDPDGAGSGTSVNCLFLGNVSASTGFGEQTYVNCVFSGNSGGHVLRTSLPISVINCTFAGNAGSEILMISSAAATVRNSIFYKSAGPMPAETSHINSANVSVQHSFLQGLGPIFSGHGNIGGSPSMSPRFADADGPDNIAGTGDDDLRLLAGSPCIDAGDNNAVPPTLTLDLDGNPRFTDDTGMPDAGSLTPPVVDMGAYEFQGTSCLADFNGDTFVDGIDSDHFNNLFAAGDPAADLNRDGFLDGIDADLFNNAFEAGC